MFTNTTAHLAAVSEASNANEVAIFATQLQHSFITAQKPSLLSDKSMDRKHVTSPRVKESYLEDAGNLPPAAAWRWKGRISSKTGHAFLGSLFLRGGGAFVWLHFCPVLLYGWEVLAGKSAETRQSY